MFVYALKKATALKLIAPHYQRVAKKGWEGVKSQVILGEGKMIVRGSAQAMGVQNSYEEYVNKTQVDDLPHGMAAVLMAASVMEH